MDDRSEAKLRGPVRTSSCEHVFRESRILRGEKYLPDGRLAKTWYRNADGTEGHTNYSYDSAGQLSQLAFWHDGISSGTTEYRYDRQARLSRIVRKTVDGTETIAETFSYDTQGYKTRTRYIPDWTLITPHGATVGIDLGDEGGTFTGSDAKSVTTVYDERGRAQESVAHDGQHQPVAHVDRKYDEQGRLREVSTTLLKRGNSKQFAEALASTSGAKRAALQKALDQIFPQGKMLNHTTFRYDEQGRVIERSSWMSLLSSDRSVKTYNQYGDELTVVTYREEKEFSFTEEGELVPPEPNDPSNGPSESRFAYVYDEHGNWTERRLLSDEHLHYIDKRELTYG